MHRGRREFLLRSSVAVSLFTRAAHAQSGWGSLVSRLEAQIPKLMKQHLVPGAAVTLIKEGEISWWRGFGVRDAASKTPVETDTVFEAASMSKPVFAYAVMKLCERGVLDLDTPLTNYTATRFLDGDPRLDLITARHVLSHRSGFQNWRSDAEPLKIHFAPGSGFTYSGEGYNYLQTVVAEVTKQPFDAYMKANMLRPFGMKSSGYVWNDTFERHAARPHDTAGRTLDNRKRAESDIARYGAAGDLHSTASEYAKFLIEVINPKPADDFRLTSKSLTEMLRAAREARGGILVVLGARMEVASVPRSKRDQPWWGQHRVSLHGGGGAGNQVGIRHDDERREWGGAVEGCGPCAG
jgi:CubicO group peptidase (beta-lactamase class C family)